jgi:hypothetical protein
MSLYQDHVESCSYEGLHLLGESRQLLPENKNLGLEIYREREQKWIKNPSS